MPYIIIGAVVIFVILIFIGMYNSLVNKRNQVKNAFGSIDTMLKKRYDLIPNLISSCKEYMQHEERLLSEITELRTQAMSDTITPEERVGIENKLNKELRTLNIAVENYPDLKANENFLQLQRSLNEVEEQISASRRAYNSAVTDYNNAVEMFPTSIMAGIMRLKQKPVFEITENERQNVDVGKLFNS